MTEPCQVPTFYLDHFCVGCWYAAQCECELKTTNSDGRFTGKPKKQKKEKPVIQEVVPEPVIEIVPEPVIEVREQKKKKVLRKLSFDIDI